jgi:hypothetical protein
MAISRRHKEHQHSDPTKDDTFKRIMSGIRKQKLEPQNAKHALMANDPHFGSESPVHRTTTSFPNRS